MYLYSYKRVPLQKYIRVYIYIYNYKQIYTHKVGRGGRHASHTRVCTHSHTHVCVRLSYIVYTAHTHTNARTTGYSV